MYPTRSPSGDGGGEESKETAGDGGDDPACPDGETEAESEGHDDTGNGG